MTGKRTEAVPRRLAAARERFDRWRCSRRLGARIPGDLWRSAAKLAQTYGLSRTTRVLGLDYYALKKHLAEDPSTSARASRPPDAPERPADEARERTAATFVELAPVHTEPPLVPGGPVPGDRAECIIELVTPHGSKMRVHLVGDRVPDVVAICRDFWKAAT